MKSVAILSRKGGCGKTQLSHLLSYGLCERNQPVMMMQTDVRAEMPPEDVLGRPYLIFGIDGRNEKPEIKFQDIYKRACNFGDVFLVIDGGANRRGIDFAAAYIADIVVVPCGYSPEDLAVARNDVEEFRAFLSKNGRGHVPVVILLNRWPGDVRRLEIIMKRSWVAEFLAATSEDRIDFRVPELTSIMDIAFHGSPSAPLNIRLQSQHLADAIMKIVGPVRSVEPAQLIAAE